MFGLNRCLAQRDFWAQLFFCIFFFFSNQCLYFHQIKFKSVFMKTLSWNELLISFLLNKNKIKQNFVLYLLNIDPYTMGSSCSECISNFYFILYFFSFYVKKLKLIVSLCYELLGCLCGNERVAKWPG